MKPVKAIQSGYTVKSGELTASGIAADGQPLRTMVDLPVGRTAPTVIRLGARQCVFVPAL